MEELAKLVHVHSTFMLTFSVLNLMFSFVAILGNLLAIRALWKASSIPVNLKKLLLSLAFSDLAVGLFAQIMFGVIIAVMLKMADNRNLSFDILCPTILAVFYFLSHLLSGASFLGVITIAVDRLFAISLHLRYQELVTSKRVVITLVSLWLTMAAAASAFILLPKGNDMVVAIIELVGLSLTTVAYIRIYKVVKYHQNQIQDQLQLQNIQATRLPREKKSALNAVCVYIVFLACYLPLFCTLMLLSTNSSGNISILAADHAALFLVFLNSSLNPLIYCWRYREMREIVKSMVMKIFRINETAT